MAETLEIEACKERLRAVLPHLKIAMSMAKLQVPDGTVGLAVVAKAPDGAGRVTATFESEGFLRDLEMLVGDSVVDFVQHRKEPTNG